MIAPRAWLAGVALASAAAVGAALVSQHSFGMFPCPWCVLQRLIFVAIAVVAGAGALLNSRVGNLASALTVDLLATAGMAAALWQHFVATSSTACVQTLADRIVSGLGLDRLLPDVFAPWASCADAAVKLLGVPYEFWSLGLYALVVAAMGMVVIHLLRTPSAASR